MRPRPRDRAAPRRRLGFTLVEATLAAGLAALAMVGVVTFFGDFLQRFTHQDDTLSAAHRSQMLLENLRKDLANLDGRPTGGLVSSSSETGTTFPKFWVHACHQPGGTELTLFPRQRSSDVDPIQGHPAGAALDPGRPEADALRAQFDRVENAMAWVGVASDETTPRFLVLNVRDPAGALVRVEYVFDPKGGSITRVEGERQTTIAPEGVRRFLATPYIEVVHDPDDPTFAPKLVKVWLELDFQMLQDTEGGKIRGRPLEFATRLFPVQLVASLKSEWNP